MSIMVTGGTGFIGHRIIRKLVDRGKRWSASTWLRPGPIWRRIWTASSSTGRHRPDSPPAGSDQHLWVHKIIHMAALLPPDTEDRPHFGMLVNIQGANNVFETARWTGIERVVYASSIAVYGVQETFGDRLVDEEDLASPINVYGMTKAANDFAAGRYRDRYGMDVRGVRICTVFGHGRVTGMTGMIGGLMMSLPAIGQPVAMDFDPSEASPMIHAEDAAEMFVQVALSTSLNHSIYISGGHLATIQDMANLVRDFVPDAQISTGDRPVPHVYLVDNSRMLADIGYEMAPLRVRVLEHMNDARREAGLPPISG